MGIETLSRLFGRRPDVAAATGLLGLGWVEALVFAPAAPSWAQAALTVVWTVPLAFRRRWPVPVLAVVMVSGPAIGLVNEQGGLVSYVLSAILASYTVGRQLDPPATWWGPGLIAGVSWTFYAATREHAADLVFVAIIYGGAWVAGQAIHQREDQVGQLSREAEQLRRDHFDRERQALSDERARIARELHDIVAHSISVITIQTQAVRHRLGGQHPEAAADLQAIEVTARDAMVELRRMLGVLRADGQPLALHPQPGLDQVQRLTEDLRGSGMRVTVEIVGTAVDLPPGVDTAAYRIVQEALTNVRKHAGGTVATVSITYARDSIRLRVDDDGLGPAGHPSDGHGLIGMRERVTLYGGTFSAGPHEAGGFRVDATLPLTRRAST
ncbi:MAG: sensor histidine kinase [Actinomycetota bacterium]|nr:sensor histidine kinase [Actinomycetota bacterium]